jgi:hypothetical protein
MSTTTRETVTEPNEEFDELTNHIDALLDEIAERDEDYQGTHEIEIKPNEDLEETA